MTIDSFLSRTKLLRYFVLIIVLHFFLVNSMKIDEPKEYLAEECTDEYCFEVNADDNDNDRGPFILDSIGIHFSFKVFLWELAVHLFWPLLNWYGTVAHSHRVLTGGLIELFFVVVPAIGILVSLALYCLVPGLEGELIVPILFYTLHKIMVAFKYATLSPTEYRRVILCTDPKLAQIYQNQIQLLSSWMAFHRQVFEFELYAAAARVGVDIDSLHFLVPQHEEAIDTLNSSKKMPKFVVKERFTAAEKWDLFLMVCDGKQKMPECVNDLLTMSKDASAARQTANIKRGGISQERRRVTIREIMEPLIHYTLHTERKQTKFSNFWALSCAAAIGIVPIFNSPPVSQQYHLQKLIFLVTTTYITIFFAWVNFRFLFTATIDTQRRLHLASVLSIMIRPVHHDYSPQVTVGEGASIVSLSRGSIKHGISGLKAGISRPFRIAVEKDVELGELPTTETRGHPACPAEDSRTRRLKNFNYDMYVPRVDADIPQNIYAWMYTRLIVQNYGKRMLLRISAYASAMVIVTLVVIVSVLIATLHAVRPLLFVQRAVVIQCLIIASVLMLFLTKHIIVGSKLNGECDAHRNLLLLNAMRCESELAELLTVVNDEAAVSFLSRANSVNNPYINQVVSFSSKEEKIPDTDIGVQSFVHQEPPPSSPSPSSPSHGQLNSKGFKTTSSKSVRIDDSSLQMHTSKLPSVSVENRPAVSMNTDHLSYIPQGSYSLHTRLKIYELEEAIKAMRRGVETMDISNTEYSSKVLGIRADTPLLFSLFSSGGAFAVALFRILVADKRYI